MNDPKAIDWLVELAVKLGGLPSSAFLALVCIAQGHFIYQSNKDDRVEALKRLEAWENSTRAEERQTEALRKVADSVDMAGNAQNEMASQITRLATIIDERIPRRS